VTKSNFNPEKLKYGDRVIDLSGQVVTFLCFDSAAINQAVIQFDDGTVQSRNMARLREFVPDEMVTLEVRLTKSQVEEIAAYPLGSVCNPLVLAARQTLRKSSE
jgi:hypothetical protein